MPEIAVVDTDGLDAGKLHVGDESFSGAVDPRAWVVGGMADRASHDLERRVADDRSMLLMTV